MSASTRSDDKGLDLYLKQVHALDGHGVKVGIQADAGTQDGVSILDIAIYNELGTEHIPPRPFIRDFAEKNAKVLGKVMDRATDMVTAGKSQAVALATLGEFVQKHQQAHVRASKSWAVPNAKATVKAKGSDVPLIDHGVLVNAIRWEKV